MKPNLEEVIKNEKSFLIAAGLAIGTRILDSVSTSLAISKQVDSALYGVRAAIEKYGLPTPEFDLISHKSAATFEANPFTRKCIEEYGINQGLFVKNVAFMVPVLTMAYFLNKMDRNDKPLTGNTILYFLSVASVIAGINNLYQYLS